MNDPVHELKPGATQAHAIAGQHRVAPQVIAQLCEAVGDGNCIRQPEQLRTYESDGLATFRATPGVVVLPSTTEEVVRCVKIAREAGLPIVARGSGTGLSGGALPIPGCVLIGLARMRKVLQVDFDNAFMRVQPGVINLDVSKAIGAQGWYYAPDPSSQSVCTIGGNVAENSGGAHCLKYGFT
ncbi:MAG: FAD-binding oxidoreductase, partial [Myxococcales bacterium]